METTLFRTLKHKSETKERECLSLLSLKCFYPHCTKICFLFFFPFLPFPPASASSTSSAADDDAAAGAAAAPHWKSDSR